MRDRSGSLQEAFLLVLVSDNVDLDQGGRGGGNAQEMFKDKVWQNGQWISYGGERKKRINDL